MNPRPTPYHGVALPTELSRHLIYYFYARASSRTIQDKFVAYYDSALPTELSRHITTSKNGAVTVVIVSYSHGRAKMMASRDYFLAFVLASALAWSGVSVALGVVGLSALAGSNSGSISLST